MANFPLHLQGSFPPSSTPNDGFRPDGQDTSGLMHQNLSFQNENSPQSLGPQYSTGQVLSPSSNVGGYQPTPAGIHRPYHSASIYKSDGSGLPSGMNAGSSVPPYPFSTSTPPPFSGSITSPPLSSGPQSVPTPPSHHVPAPTPPPTQPTPPPTLLSAVRRAAAASSSSRNEPLSLLSKEKIEQLAKTVDPNLKLDDDVQEFLQQHAGELIDELAGMSAKMAHARKSKTLEVQDVRYYLEHNWNIYIPGFGADPVKAKKKLPETEAHKNRQAIIKKHLKKF